MSANLDYVVDGLVLHMREPTRFPHAPHLLAALLTSSSVSHGLLPALAEPASAAVQGLSILARSAHPQHVSAFLVALHPIAAALATQAQQVKHAAATALAALRTRKSSEQEPPEAADGYSGTRQGADGLECEGDSAGDGGFREAAEFFGDYHKPHQIVLPVEEVEVLDRRRWTTYAAAELSSAIANAAAPLLVAEDLRVALIAHKTVAVRASASQESISLTECCADELRCMPSEQPFMPCHPKRAQHRISTSELHAGGADSIGLPDGC